MSTETTLNEAIAAETLPQPVKAYPLYHQDSEKSEKVLVGYKIDGQKLTLEEFDTKYRVVEQVEL